MYVLLQWSVPVKSMRPTPPLPVPYTHCSTLRTCILPCRHWSVPVKQLLQDGDNTLVITIRPAAPESERLQAQHPYAIPALRQMGAIGTYTFVRKPASGEGCGFVA
jgi:hypothetical protein